MDLLQAVRENKVDDVHLLLQHGANISTSILAIATHGHIKIVREFTDCNPDDVLPPDMVYGYLEMVRLPIKHGADVSAENDVSLRGSASLGYRGSSIAIAS